MMTVSIQLRTLNRLHPTRFDVSKIGNVANYVKSAMSRVLPENSKWHSIVFLNSVTRIKHKTILTHHHTPAKMTTYCKSSVGRSNPFSNGDNTPQLKAVFFCPSFLELCNFASFKFIMTVLFGQPLWLVVPLRGITTPFNTVTNIVVNISDGFIKLQSNGITA